MNSKILLSGIVLKFVLLTSSIIQLGLLVRNFDEIQLAIFFIFLGVYSIFNICEIGAGTSIVSLSQLDPTNSSKHFIRGLMIYSKFISVFIIFSFIFLITPIFSSFEGKWLINLPKSDWRGEGLLLTIFSLIIARVTTSLIHRFCWAIGHGYFSNLAQILTSSALTVSMFLYTNNTQLTNLQTICLIYYGIPITIDLIIILKFIKLINFKIAIEKNFSDWNNQLKESVRFLGVAAVGVVAFKLDGTTVAFLLSAKHVVMITVVWRIYSVVPNLLDFLSKSFWSRFSEAIRLKDRNLARKSLMQYYKIVFSVSLFAGITIFMFLDKILLILDDSSFRSESVPTLLNISSLLLAIAMAVSGPTSMYMNAAMLGKDLFKVSVVLTLLNLFLSVLLTYLLGVAGPILGSAVSLATFGIYANHKIAIRHIAQL